MTNQKQPTKPAYPWICPECDGKAIKPAECGVTVLGKSEYPWYKAEAKCPNCRGEGIVWTEKAHSTQTQPYRNRYFYSEADEAQYYQGLRKKAGDPVPCVEHPNLAAQGEKV